METNESKTSIEEIDKRIYNSSLEKIATILTPFEKFIVEPFIEKVPYQTCTIVWKELSINYRPIQNLEELFIKGTDLYQSVLEVCEKADVRVQKIRPKSGWWKRDERAMVAFLKNEKRPVALIPKEGSYYMIDCYVGKREKVTEEKSSNFDETFYTFHPTLLGESFSGKNLLKVLFNGEAANLRKIAFYLTLSFLLSSLFPLFNKVLFDHVLPNFDVPMFIQIILWMVVIGISIATFSYISSLLFIRIDAITNSRLQSIQWDLLLKMNAKFFHKHAAGDLVHKMSLTDDMRKLMGENTMQVFISGIVGFAYLLPIALLDLPFALVTLSIVSLMIFATITLIPKLFRYHYINGESAAWLNSSQINIFSNIGQLRSYGAEKRAFAYWGKSFAEMQESSLKIGNLNAAIDTIVHSTDKILYLLLLFWFALFYLHKGSENGVSLGTFMAIQTALTSFGLSSANLISIIINNIGLYAQWNLVNSLFPKNFRFQKAGSVKVKIEGNITAKNLFFRYAKKGGYIVDNVSLEIFPKEFLAITGKSGNGKSTLLKLLANQEKPLEGSILYEGIELQNILHTSFHTQVAMVLQNTNIVTATLLENILLGRAASRKEIDEAVELAGLKRDVEEFPMGMQTLLTSGGLLLSIGQRQKLLLARALLLKPKILFLDEATSGLYWKDQENLIKRLREKEITLIAVTHDENLIKLADRVMTI